MQTDELLKQRLKQAMENLTFRQKQLIILKFFDGLTYEDIAKQTNQSIKTAYNTIYDALKVCARFWCTIKLCFFCEINLRKITNSKKSNLFILLKILK